MTIRDTIVKACSPAVFYVEVKDTDNDLHMGTCFHLGDGYFVTAKHVVEKKEIVKIARFATFITTPMPQGPAQNTEVASAKAYVDLEIVGHHPKADVSIIKVKSADVEEASQSQAIPLDLPSIDKSESELLMTDVIVMGYPEIPMCMPHLVIFQAEIAAVTKDYDGERRLIVTGMARGGFSGGPVLHIDPTMYRVGHAIGIVTDSAVKNDAITESGFITALSTKPILDTIEHLGLKIRLIEETKSAPENIQRRR